MSDVLRTIRMKIILDEIAHNTLRSKQYIEELQREGSLENYFKLCRAFNEFNEVLDAKY